MEKQDVTQSDKNKVITLHRVMHSQLLMIDIFAEEFKLFANLLSWLKSSFDKDHKFAVPKDTSELDLKKIHHDYYATVAQLLATRAKYKFKDMAPIVEAAAFSNEMANAIRAEIELIEPPKVEEQKPYEMDLSHVKADKSLEVVQ